MKYRFLAIDTLDRAHDVIEALMEPRATARLRALFRIFPEMANWTHREIAANSGLTRETVSRAMVRMCLGRRELMEEGPGSHETLSYRRQAGVLDEEERAFFSGRPREEAPVSG